MSGGKGKYVEVAFARNRLGATLQNLVDHKDDLSQTSSDGDGPNCQPELPTPSRTMHSPAISPRKSASKSNRKRKRKDDLGSLGSGQTHHTYVMKLFDRSVDLAQFDEETPLYPVCRSWIRNDPQNKGTVFPPPRSPSPDTKQTSDDEMDKMPDVYELPPPIKQEARDHHVDLRIPSPTPQPVEHLDINSVAESAPPEQLLLNHMSRWKDTRLKWREAGLINEMRYSDCMFLLKDMYERTCLKDR